MKAPSEMRLKLAACCVTTGVLLLALSGCTSTPSTATVAQEGVTPSSAPAITASMPQQIAAPDVVSDTVDKAIFDITSKGLDYDFSFSTAPDEPEHWKVVGQEPAAGAMVDPNTVVYLDIQEIPQKVSVPKLVGKSDSAAESALDKAGFDYEVTNDSYAANWKVKSTSPKAGSKVTKGTTVRITLQKPKSLAGYDNEGDNVYFKWGDWSGDEFISYAHASVVALDGCSSLYAEANLLDSSGSIVGYTNDLASNVPAGGKVKLEFAVTEDDASRIRLTELNCY